MAGVPRVNTVPLTEHDAEDGLPLGAPPTAPTASAHQFPPAVGGIKRYDTDELHELMPKIQAATLKQNSESKDNSTPTRIPAPQKQFFGVLGQRHIICISGLPNTGKGFVACELGWYHSSM